MKGDRILSVAINPGADNNFNNAFAQGQALGMQATSLALTWDDLETAPNTYDPNPNNLAIAESFYPGVNTSISLEINPIDTVKRRMPSDLMSLAFDDPIVITRYENLLKWVFSQIPDVPLTSLTIGNEVDGYLISNPSEWSHYQNFYQQVSAYARTLRPGLKVGVKGEFSGIVGNAKANMQALNQYSDVVQVTYYPLNGDFSPEPPTVVSTDFNTLTGLYPGRSIYLLEAGYPSSTDCGSSEALQSQFIDQVFSAWDAHADQIKLISFFALTDFSPAFVQQALLYYGVSTPCFADYLGNLGLITYNGQQKQAYMELSTDAHVRGW
ncbi:MAG: hypothetical protein ACRETA_11195 [Gammaproteobacteria bacterium]